MILYRKLKDFQFEIESVEFETKNQEVTEGFTRTTTVVILKGGNEKGCGEDVIYEEEFHKFYEEKELKLEGNYSFQEFSEKLESAGITGPGMDGHQENMRRWAFESAALDLALKQNDTNLAKALDREYSPLRFVVSPRMEEPEDFTSLRNLIEKYPEIEFKLDYSEEWSEEFIEKLASTGKIRVVDFKALYRQKQVRPEVRTELYGKVAEKLKDAILEDPDPEEVDNTLKEEKKRLSWDYPVTGTGSIEELPFHPEVINIKPSRFGTVRSLMETLEYCIEKDIEIYAGGQFELGPGRQHIQAIASIFYPGAPNDAAPRIYNTKNVPGKPPESPLAPEENNRGLEWKWKE